MVNKSYNSRRLKSNNHTPLLSRLKMRNHNLWSNQINHYVVAQINLHKTRRLIHNVLPKLMGAEFLLLIEL